MLWIRGALPPPPRVAIVGSRAATPYGLDHAERLAHDLSRMGYTIVSGLAHGIDAAAHRGAHAAAGPGVAVLAGGVDRITPPHHESLGRDVLARGALIAEHPPGEPPFRGRFLRRNRLIAAFAAATIVVEAARKSGALSTAAAARRLNRHVFAFPGDVDRATSAGCNGLIAGGARVCTCAADVARVVAPPVSTASRLRATMGDTPRSLAELASGAGLSEPETLRLLLRMQWAGEIRALPGQKWMRA